MVTPNDAIELFLYITATCQTLETVLLKEEDGKQLSVYYISKVLQQAELNYSPTKNMVFTLVVAARKLRQYFQVRHIIVLIDQPFKDICKG